MKPLEKFAFSPKSCLDELELLQKLLDSKEELKEREDILPFFKLNTNIAAWIATYSPSISQIDRLNTEYTLYGDFRADLIVGDSSRKAYCLIEFEDASEESIFKGSDRTTKEWSNRFEHGFGQIIDWFWKIDDLRNTSQGRAIFGDEVFDFMAMLVIGRDKFLSAEEKARLAWRIHKVTINSNKIVCLTFDQLVAGLRDNLSLYKSLASP